MTNSGEDADSSGQPPADPAARQRVVRAPGQARRAKLTPAPDTDPSPEVPVPREEGGVASVGRAGENDARLKRDRPPHW